MTKTTLDEKVKSALSQYVKEHPNPQLLNTYLFFVEKSFSLSPILYSKDKIIYQNPQQLVEKLEKAGKIWHETEIKIGLSEEDVNEDTKRIYICPFTGKVFGDNTHPNPQDAIYDWVSKCPENTERSGGLRVKRFFISEDPEVIKRYRDKTISREPVTKTVFSSVSTGKLFNSKESVVKDFIKSLKRMSLEEVQSQNRYAIEEGFLRFIQEQLEEEKVGEFVVSLAELEEFVPFIQKWVG